MIDCQEYSEFHIVRGGELKTGNYTDVLKETAIISLKNFEVQLFISVHLQIGK